MDPRPIQPRLIGVGYRLADLCPARPTDQDPMRVRAADRFHRGLARPKSRSTDARSQARREAGIGGANTNVDLRRPDTEIEETCATVLRVERVAVRPKLGDDRALAHAAHLRRQADRDAVAP